MPAIGRNNLIDNGHIREWTDSGDGPAVFGDDQTLLGSADLIDKFAQVLSHGGDGHAAGVIKVCFGFSGKYHILAPVWVHPIQIPIKYCLFLPTKLSSYMKF